MSNNGSEEQGRYVYCVTRSQPIDDFGTAGMDGQPIQLLTDGDLAVVVSASAVQRYRLSRRHTLTHEQVIERAMELGTVLPVKFGTVAENEALIRQKLLRQRAGDLRQLLREMDGKVELGVKVIWNRERIFADIVENTPALRRLRDQLADLPASETHYERIQLGQMVEETLTQRRSTDADLFMDRLAPLAVDSRRNDVYGETMVLNAAFLVEKTREAEFDAAMETLDAEMNGLFEIKYVGPLPPFNFVNLVISWN